MKCQFLFSRKNTKNIISLSSAEFAHIIVGVRTPAVPKITSSFVHNKKDNL